MADDLSRVLRDTLEALQVELREARREREQLREETARLREALVRAQRNSEPPPIRGQSARAMRERCLATIRAAMPDEVDHDAVFSKHALFDVLDDVAGEIERIPVLQ